MNARSTVQRTMILKTVRAMTNHPTADAVFEGVAAVCPAISKATVYRDLNQLAAHGEIRRIAVANAPDRYDLTSGPHTHCICTVCGRVFDYRLRTEPELDDARNDGFSSESFDVMVNGICKDCRREQNG